MTGKNDRGATLRAQVKVFPLKAKLPENFIEWPPFTAGRRIVRNRMQADIMIPTAQAIEGIQTTNGRVPFENAHILSVISQADSRSQAGETGTNDD
jgi:hypothetical protein